MGGLFDSLGVSLAFAGVVILLAGVFLTPIRGVLFNSLRPRRDEEIVLPPLPVQPAPAVEVQPRAAAPADTVVRQVAATAEAIDAAREQEALFARALVTAQRTAEDLVRKAKAEAQDIIDKAQTTANDIVSAGRRNASEVLAKAEQEAGMIVTAANENATARLALLQAEVERLVVEAHQVFQGAQQSVQQNVASLKSRLELHAGDSNARSRGDREPAPATSAGPAAARDGSGWTWVRPPLGDDRTAVGVGADGVTTERRSGRTP
jgi:cell division septum initiation protein DivIVA